MSRDKDEREHDKSIEKAFEQAEKKHEAAEAKEAAEDKVKAAADAKAKADAKAAETKEPETQLEEYDPTPVDPNTVGGGVPFEADTRTIAEQLAALTPGVGG
jgi:membrane protein involved in colicin uptake